MDFQFPIATIAIVMSLFVSGIISMRVYFAKIGLSELDIRLQKAYGKHGKYQNHVQSHENFKRIAKYFPYVNKWARSVMGLLVLYVSTILKYLSRYTRG